MSSSLYTTLVVGLAVLDAEPREQRLQAALALPHALRRIPVAADALAQRLHRERGRIDFRHLVPIERRGNTGIGGGPNGVRTRDRLVAGVLAEVDENAAPVCDAPGGRRDLLIADAPLDLLRQRLGEASHVGILELRLDRRHDVQTG